MVKKKHHLMKMKKLYEIEAMFNRGRRK